MLRLLGRNTKLVRLKFPRRNIMDDKLKSQHYESAVDPYAGLSPEDAECLQHYDSKEGKKVVRKVRRENSPHH